MARISYTSINDIHYIRKNKHNLIILIRKIKKWDSSLAVKYYEDFNRIIDIIKILAIKRPVIFNSLDFDFIESLEISIKGMKNEYEYDENFIKITSNKLLDFLLEKEKKYKKIYNIN